MKYLSLRASVAAVLALAAPLSALAASATTCSGLKSGTYAFMNPQDSDPAWRVNLVTVDAVALTATDREGTIQLTADAESCHFKLPSGGGDVVVSKKGVVLVRGAGGGDDWWSVGLPVKKARVDDVVGNWNFIRQETRDGSIGTGNGVATIAADGAFTVAACQPGGGGCAATEAGGTVKKVADGGLKITNLDGGVERFFLATQADGSKLMIGVGLDHDAMTVMAPVNAVGLPTAGEKYAHWQVQRGSDGLLSALDSASFKVLSVDEGAQTYTRKNLLNCRVETWAVNQGRDGFNRRPSGTYTDCADGQQKSYSANLALALRNSWGISAFGWQGASSSFFGISVVKAK